MKQHKWVKYDDEKKSLNIPYEKDGDTAGDIFARIQRMEGLIQKAKNRKKRYERLIEREINQSSGVQELVKKGIRLFSQEKSS